MADSIKFIKYNSQMKKQQFQKREIFNNIYHFNILKIGTFLVNFTDWQQLLLLVDLGLVWFPNSVISFRIILILEQLYCSQKLKTGLGSMTKVFGSPTSGLYPDNSESGYTLCANNLDHFLTLLTKNGKVNFWSKLFAH